MNKFSPKPAVLVRLRSLFGIAFCAGAGVFATMTYGQDDFGYDFSGEESDIGSQVSDSAPSEIRTTTLGLGLEYIGADNWQFGRYNSRHEQGLLPTLVFDAFNWQRESGLYWRALVDDLGTDGPSINAAVGRFNAFKFSAAYTELYATGNRSGRTPYRALGDNGWMLPGGWQAAPSTFAMTELSNTAVRFDQNTQRKQLSLDSAVKLDSHWWLEVHGESEEKTGTQLTGAAMYFNAARGYAVLLPDTLDQQTHQGTVKLRYSGRRLQASGQYQLSVFDNHVESLRWQNAYAGVGAAVSDYPGGFGQVAADPDNQFQQLRVQGAYWYSPRLSMQWDLAMGEMEQSESLLPYTINNALSVPGALPSEHFDGQVDTRHINLTLLAKPRRSLKIKASYSYDERDNRSPRDLYLPVHGDSANQVAATRGIYNVPTGSEKDIYSIEASLRLPKRMRLTLGYDFTETGRTNSAVFNSEEDLWQAELRWPIATNLVLDLSYQFSDRQADTYHYAQFFGGRYTTAYINSLPEAVRYQNHPLLRQYHLASREQDTFRARVNWAPAAQWSMNADLSYQDTGYDETVLGLTDQHKTELVWSATYQREQDFSLYAFLSYSDYQSEQASRQFRGGIDAPWPDLIYPLTEASDPARNWFATLADSSTSIGLGGEWLLRPDVLTLSLDYVLVDTRAASKLHAASGLANLQALPDDDSTLHDIKLQLDYGLNPRTDVSVQCRYYRFDQSQLAFDGLYPSSIGNVLATGQQPANESIALVGVSYLYRFD